MSNESGPRGSWVADRFDLDPDTLRYYEPALERQAIAAFQHALTDPNFRPRERTG